MTTTLSDTDDDLFADLVVPAATVTAAPPVDVPSTLPVPIEVKETAAHKRSVIAVLDAQHAALRDPNTRRVLFSHIALDRASYADPKALDIAEQAEMTLTAASKHLKVLEAAEMLSVCKFTGSVHTNVGMFHQFCTWVLKPYRDELLNTVGPKETAWLLGEQYVDPQTQAIMDKYAYLDTE